MSRPPTVVGVVEVEQTGVAGAISFTITPHVDTQVGDLVCLYVCYNITAQVHDYPPPWWMMPSSGVTFAADGRLRFTSPASRYQDFRAWDVRAGDAAGAFTVSGACVSTWWAKAVAITLRSADGNIRLDGLSGWTLTAVPLSLYADYGPSAGGSVSESEDMTPDAAETANWDDVVMCLLVHRVGVAAITGGAVPPPAPPVVSAAADIPTLTLLSSGADVRDAPFVPWLYFWQFRGAQAIAYAISQEDYAAPGPHAHAASIDGSWAGSAYEQVEGYGFRYWLIGPGSGAGSLSAFRTWAERLVVVHVDTSGHLIASVYDPDDASPADFTIDGNAGCTWPSFQQAEAPLIEGSYLRGSTAYVARSYDHGRTWTLVSIAGSYTAQSSVRQKRRRVFAGWNGTAWVCRVKPDDGVWSGEVSMALTSPSGKGSFVVSEEGEDVLAFAYIDTSQDVQIVKCRAVSNDGTGSWA